MNPKERTVLIFLTVVLLTGIVVNLVKRQRLAANLRTITLVPGEPAHPRADSQAQIPPLESVIRIPADTDGGRTTGEGLLDLNSASVAELDLLPGIGPVLAQRIADYRTQAGRFRSKEELRKVSGIGPKKFAAIKDRITIR
jgi:competence protein ComEA